MLTATTTLFNKKKESQAACIIVSNNNMGFNEAWYINNFNYKDHLVVFCFISIELTWCSILRGCCECLCTVDAFSKGCSSCHQVRITQVSQPITCDRIYWIHLSAMESKVSIVVVLLFELIEFSNPFSFIIEKCKCINIFYEFWNEMQSGSLWRNYISDYLVFQFTGFLLSLFNSNFVIFFW